MSITVSSSGPVTIFYDDFETDKGWVRNPFGTDTATKGLWERAIPENTWWWGPKQMGSTTSGWYNLVTGAKAGLTPSSNDVDGGLTSIKSPAIAPALQRQPDPELQLLLRLLQQRLQRRFLPREDRRRQHGNCS